MPPTYLRWRWWRKLTNFSGPCCAVSNKSLLFLSIHHRPPSLFICLVLFRLQTLLLQLASWYCPFQPFECNFVILNTWYGDIGIKYWRRAKPSKLEGPPRRNLAVGNLIETSPHDPNCFLVRLFDWAKLSRELTVRWWICRFLCTDPCLGTTVKVSPVARPFYVCTRSRNFESASRPRASARTCEVIGQGSHVKPGGAVQSCQAGASDYGLTSDGDDALAYCYDGLVKMDQTPVLFWQVTLRCYLCWVGMAPMKIFWTSPANYYSDVESYKLSSEETSWIRRWAACDASCQIIFAWRTWFTFGRMEKHWSCFYIAPEARNLAHIQVQVIRWTP